jgi:hypothetical protein
VPKRCKQASLRKSGAERTFIRPFISIDLVSGNAKKEILLFACLPALVDVENETELNLLKLISLPFNWNCYCGDFRAKHTISSPQALFSGFSQHVFPARSLGRRRLQGVCLCVNFIRNDAMHNATIYHFECRVASAIPIFSCFCLRKSANKAKAWSGKSLQVENAV